MSNNFDRRVFLRASALSCAAWALSPYGLSEKLVVAPAVRKQKVIVVGAGISGLTAAFELMQSGHDVSVFEARLRPGGRVYTMRGEFADGMYAEAGAYDFGDAYTLLQHYIHLFELPIDAGGAAEKTASANETFFLGGKRYIVPAGTEPDWPYTLTAEERKLGLRGLWDRYLLPSRERPIAPREFAPILPPPNGTGSP